MPKYIDKDALAAEIKKRLKEAESHCGGYKSYDEHCCDNCTVEFYEEFLEILDTLEVKEVDLKKEIYETAEAFAKIIRANLIGIDKDVQYRFEQLYKQITGERMYQGYSD